jgi:pantoate--beta-alanine ligase
MEIFYYPIEWNEIYKSRKLMKKRIGFVPTMGAIHNGHLSLIKKSNLENEITVVSIFLNPTQFNDKNDLEKYPSNLESDIEILKENNVDYLFIPNYSTIYPDNYTYQIQENDISKILCGANRMGHFEGVLTIVAKLFMIIKPTVAYFGEKDYQQYLLIKNMAKAFFIDVNIIPCPTIREEDGLAMSSRNLLLSKKEREIAAKFPKILQSDKSINDKISELTKAGFKVEYLEEKFERLFAAVYLGKVRLIDNVKI